MKVSELRKLLRKTNCRLIRQGHNHEIWLNPDTGTEFQLPRHNSKELASGTAFKILKSAGIR